MVKKFRHTLIHYIIVVLIIGITRGILGLFFAGLSYLGYWCYRQVVSPFNIILAFIFLGCGLSLMVFNLWEIVLSLTWDYNRTHCPFCRPSSEPQEILSEKNGRPGR